MGRGFLDEVGREAHLASGLLRALPYLCFLALGAAAGVESCVATLALVARRRSSRARQYRLAAGLPQQICVALSVALKQGAELQFLRSSTHLMCTKALHSLRVPGKALQTDAASTSGPTRRRSLASAHDSKGLPASHSRALEYAWLKRRLVNC